MRVNPFASEAPPKFVRAELYRPLSISLSLLRARSLCMYIFLCGSGCGLAWALHALCVRTSLSLTQACVHSPPYRYEYAKPGSEEARKGQWWTRTRVGEYIEPTSLADIAHIYKQFGWPAERVPTAPREGGAEGRERGTESSAEEEGGGPTGKGSQASI